MFSRKKLDTVVGGIAIGCLALALVGYWFAMDQMSKTKIAGFLVGLCSGFISMIAGQLWKRTRSNLALRILFIVFSPIGIFVLLPLSAGLAGGYFLGSSASFAFSWALASMIQDSRHHDS